MAIKRWNCLEAFRTGRKKIVEAPLIEKTILIELWGLQDAV